jgi:hypothetical protein
MSGHIGVTNSAISSKLYYCIALHVETTRKVLSINISFIVISQQSIVGLLSISELLASGDYERV